MCVYRNYFPLNIIRVIKLVRMRPVWNVAWKCIEGFGGETREQDSIYKTQGIDGSIILTLRLLMSYIYIYIYIWSTYS